MKAGDIKKPGLGAGAVLRRPFFWIMGAIVAVFAIAPSIGENVELREDLLLAAVYVTLASNINLILGYAGYVNFGSIVFFGLGGYFTIYFMSALGWGLVAASLIGGLAVSALAYAFGLGILRLRGAYFALATIGVNEAVQAFVTNFTPWGGGTGIYLSTELFQPLGGPAQALWTIYYALVGIMGLSLYLSYFIKISKFGLGLRAIGENENAAAVLGVPTPRYKAMVYCVSAFLPAVAGGLYFLKGAFIQPTDAFDLNFSTEAIVTAMLGGQGTVLGPALGAYVYEELRSWLLTSDTFANFQLVISGALLLVIVLFAPGGLMGWLYRQWPALRKVLE